MDGPPIRVLLVEDDRDDYFLVRDWFAELGAARYHLDWVAGYDAALDAMRQGRHDVYLLDFRLGERTGLELLRAAVAGGCGGPVILLTGQEDGEIGVEAMKAGAADYLSKGQIGAPLLERTVRYAIERQRTQASLRQAQKMEAVGRLAGGVAHDFNNMMTIVTGYSEVLLARLPPEDPARDLVQQIKKAGERCAALTGQLLAFSRKQLFTLKVLDLNTVLADLGKMLRPLLGEDIDLVTVPGPALGQVRADPGQMEQVIVNLALNARDAMPRGGRLTIETRNVTLDAAFARVRPEVRPGRYVLLTVSDTGCGMDQATQAHLFEPFFTTKEAGKGTGLGLATVYGIIKQSNGFIYASSELGRGTTFTIYLPRLEEPAPVFQPAPETALPPGGPETVLLVEDEPGVRALLRHVLLMNGYSVLEAGHGGEALRVSEHYAGPLHLLITDVVMPEMSGGELAARLKQLRPDLKVLFLSGYTEDAVVRHGVSEAESAFLQKPFSLPVLARKVREVLDQESPRVSGSRSDQGGNDG
jgi:signal transduction histidine kinase